MSDSTLSPAELSLRRVMEESIATLTRPKRYFGAVTGVGVEPETDWVEPMHALLVRDPKRGPEALRFDPDRSAWRDATSLFQATGGHERHRRPAACSQIATLVEEDVLPRSSLFSLELYGLASSQAAIGLWRAERMPLPPRLLTDPERLEAVRSALEAAESAEDALRASAWLLARVALAPGKRSPDKKDVGALADRLEAGPRFWTDLGARFDDLLRDVGSEADPEAAVARWKAFAQDTARRVLGDAARQIGAHARALQAGALAERHLAKRLAKLFSPTVSPQEVPSA